MKFVSVVTALSLALSPVMASAQTAGAATSGGDQKRPAAGPLAGRALANSEIPAGAIIIGGLILLGGVVIGLAGSSDANNNTNRANVAPN